MQPLGGGSGDAVVVVVAVVAAVAVVVVVVVVVGDACDGCVAFGGVVDVASAPVEVLVPLKALRLLRVRAVGSSLLVGLMVVSGHWWSCHVGRREGALHQLVLK